ncbi:MAG: histidine phosphatase family protein [Fibrobacteraceae bacterium]|nr:histidine phosphatase family protein [Fibrobacteraceae bacterium]
MILWTLRHTKPYNPADVCYGRTDFDVSPDFEEEYPPALKVLAAHCEAKRLFSSPLKRCIKLAGKVSNELELPIEPKEAIIELNFGSWEGQKLTEVPREEMAAWKADLRGFRFPNGESFHDMDKRVTAFIKELLGEEEVLFVTHAGVIAAIEHSICKVPDEKFVEGQFPYTMVTRFEIGETSTGKLLGTFETIYGGIKQSPLVTEKS